MKTKNIMIVGVGGQGTLLTSRVLGGFINILCRPDRRFARHNLTCKLLLTFHKLIEVCIKGLLCYIAVNIYLRIFIALTDNSTGTLLQI